MALSSSSSSATFFCDDSSNSTSLQTPRTLRGRCSVAFRCSTFPPSYGTIPITSKVHDQPYYPRHPHKGRLSLMEAVIFESDIADQLHLITEQIVSPKSAVAPLNPKGPVGPHISNLPRRRTRTQGVRREGIVDAITQPTGIKKTPKRDECRCLQELVPGLFVAFEDDRLAFGDGAAAEYGERLKTHKGEDFTHIVSLSTEGAAEVAMMCAAGAKSHLRLVIPAARDAADDVEDDNVQLQLSPSQLATARDFLSLTNLRLSPTAYSKSADVRILITTPRNCRVDAMAIASCYLSFASGHSVRKVLAHFDDGNCYLSVWQGIMDWRTWDIVESVARRCQ